VVSTSGSSLDVVVHLILSVETIKPSISSALYANDEHGALHLEMSAKTAQILENANAGTSGSLSILSLEVNCKIILSAFFLLHKSFIFIMRFWACIKTYARLTQLSLYKGILLYA
jgi:hypothetical protein